MWRIAAACLLAGCANARPSADDGGPHPAGFAEPASPAFHGLWLRANVYPLAFCRGCHGADYGGGAVGVSCTSQSCHTRPVESCDTCHGRGNRGAPPPALGDATDPAMRGVGAHQRHLEPALPDRMGRVVACESCHRVPATARDPGHIGPAPAPVRLAGGGTYDPASLTCVVGCHWDRTPGPRWTDTSGAPRACDGCHAFPPDRTRKGTPHPSVTGEVTVCRSCHPFDPSTHVDGIVELLK